MAHKKTTTQSIIAKHNKLQAQLERVLVNYHDKKAGVYRDYVPVLRELLQLESIINKREQKHDNK